MTDKLIIALLSLVAIGSLAAVFILWAKLDEQKKLTQEECDKRWDEISRSAGLEKDLDFTRQLLDCAERAEMCYRRENEQIEFMLDESQDKLSAILCPTNNHVWRDGVCVKCGRMKDAEVH